MVSPGACRASLFWRPCGVGQKLRSFFLSFSSPDHDDEFVSESYQASTEDINEANASMKRLGVTGKKLLYKYLSELVQVGSNLSKLVQMRLNLC